MATLKALDLEEQLEVAARTPVCALVGQDDALRSRCLGLLKDAAAPPDLPGSTVRRFEDVPEARDVLDELRTVPFMGLDGRRAVVVDKGDAFLAACWEHLARYLRSPSATSTLMLCLDRLDARQPPGTPRKEAEAEKERQKAWQDFVKTVHGRGTVILCATPRWQDARRWVRSLAEQMGRRLTPRAVEALVESTGPNLLALQNELEKLAAYAGAETTVTERDVNEVVAQARARSVFDLAEAVSRADASGALRLCGRLLLRGETREGIVSILALQLRRLWQAKRLHAAGATEAEIRRQMDLREFVVRRLLEAVPALSDERLAHQLDILSAADVESKTTSLRSQEERLWLENLLARLCRG